MYDYVVLLLHLVGEASALATKGSGKRTLEVYVCDSLKSMYFL